MAAGWQARRDSSPKLAVATDDKRARRSHLELVLQHLRRIHWGCCCSSYSLLPLEPSPGMACGVLVWLLRLVHRPCHGAIVLTEFGRADAEALGLALAADLRNRGAAEILAALAQNP